MNGSPAAADGLDGLRARAGVVSGPEPRMARRRGQGAPRPRCALALLAAAALLLAAATQLLSATSAAAAAGRARASFSQIESEMMCVVCHEPLVEANSPEAVDERNYIRTLIAQGESSRQIERAMVAAYGPAVLAMPPANGFNLLVYVVPPLVVAAGAAFLLVTLPRWRRRSRTAAAQPIAPDVALDPQDARRLEEELGRIG